MTFPYGFVSDFCPWYFPSLAPVALLLRTRITARAAPAGCQTAPLRASDALSHTSDGPPEVAHYRAALAVHCLRADTCPRMREPCLWGGRGAGSLKPSSRSGSHGSVACGPIRCRKKSSLRAGSAVMSALNLICGDVVFEFGQPADGR